MRQVTVHFRRANLHGKQQQNRGPGGRTAQMADDECCINLLLLEEITVMQQYIVTRSIPELKASIQNLSHNKKLSYFLI
jgi:hypothetical protein